jgi:hypothetical protein
VPQIYVVYGANKFGTVDESANARTGRRTNINAKKEWPRLLKMMTMQSSFIPVRCVRRRPITIVLSASRYGTVEGIASVTTGKNTKKTARIVMQPRNGRVGFLEKID